MNNSRIRRKTQKRMFLLVSRGHIFVPLKRDTNMTSPYKVLEIWVKCFPNIAHMKYCTDLVSEMFIAIPCKASLNPTVGYAQVLTVEYS